MASIIPRRIIADIYGSGAVETNGCWRCRQDGNPISLPNMPRIALEDSAFAVNMRTEFEKCKPRRETC